MANYTERNQAYWDQLADTYQTQTHISCGDFHYGPLLPGDSEWHLLPQKLQGLDCLELGCGAAQNSIYLALGGASCTAVDISAEQLAHARTLAAEHHTELNLIQADIETFDTADRFALVHSCHAVQFTADIPAAIARMCRFVKPGGKLILSTVHPLAAAEWVNLEEEDGVLLKDYFKPAADRRRGKNGSATRSTPLTLEALTNAVLANGLQLEQLLEPKAAMPQHGKLHTPYWSDDWLAHLDELQHIPYTVIIVARKPLVLGTTAQPEPDVAALAAKRPVMKLRAAVFRAVRSFFDDNDFLEVFTPVRIPAPALEDYIDAEPSGTHWLRTSPELHMKRILAAGEPRIYQIGPCFRMGENGSRHLPEFQMLEWYRRNDTWRTVLDDAKHLLNYAAQTVLGTTRIPFRGEILDVSGNWDEITVEDAFRRYADADLDEAIAEGRFEEILCSSIEPHLGHGRPTVLTEYPLACSGLSQPIPGRPNRVERWEVYVAGLELGNACSELVDPVEQLKRFQDTARLRGDDGREVYPLDEPFMEAIRSGIPPSAGVAIGFDRLVMMLANCTDIHDVSFL